MTLTIRNDLFYTYEENSKSENIQNDPVIIRTKKEVKRKGLQDISNKQNQLKTQKKKERKATYVPADEKENTEDRRYSNDMRDACKTICQICGASVFLATMRGHTRGKHKVTIDEYKRQYGNHRDMITEKVYHKCGICFETVLLDSDDINGHLKRYHSISHKNYNAEYMVAKNKTEQIGKNSRGYLEKDDLSISLKLNKDINEMPTREDINTYMGREECSKSSYIDEEDKDDKDDEDVEMTTDELLSALYLPYFLERIM